MQVTIFIIIIESVDYHTYRTQAAFQFSDTTSLTEQCMISEHPHDQTMELYAHCGGTCLYVFDHFLLEYYRVESCKEGLWLFENKFYRKKNLHTKKKKVFF